MEYLINILLYGDDIQKQKVYDAIVKVIGEPEDDGESEYALIERLDSLPKEKQQKILDLVK